MKMRKLSIACAAMAGLTLTTSCIGSFALTNKLKSWNEQVTDNKFLNELIFVGLHIVPLYELTILADAVVINSIEFWGGDNPFAAGKTTEIESENGKFLVTTTKDGYRIEKEGEEKPLELKFDQEVQSWNIVTPEESYELMRFNNDGTICLNLQDGRHLNVMPNAQGVVNARQAACGQMFLATR